MRRSLRANVAHHEPARRQKPVQRSVTAAKKSFAKARKKETARLKTLEEKKAKKAAQKNQQQ